MAKITVEYLERLISNESDIEKLVELLNEKASEPDWINSDKITDKFLNEHFHQYDNGYWILNENVIISCEGHVYAESPNNTLVWFAEVNNLEELKMLLTVIKIELPTLDAPTQ